MASAKTISIQELYTGGYRFVIKPYQRGYRWETKQIEYLIKDLSSIKSGTEYCLQPIIVKPTDNENEKEFELVDGQQRLTTLWILKEIYASFTDIVEDPEAKQNYEIVYENKYPLQSILNNFHSFFADMSEESSRKTLAGIIEGEIDPYFEFASRIVVDDDNNTEAFYKEMHPDIDSFIDSVLSILNYKADVKRNGVVKERGFHFFLKSIFGLDQDGFSEAQSIKVIWYELERDNKNEDPITVFTNVNANKIKLTNSELVKAVMLHELGKNLGNYSARDKLALEWESIEQQLNSENFWAFIHGRRGSLATRIDYLFMILAQYRDIKNNGEEYWIYDYVQDIVEREGVEKLWNSIRQVYYTLLDWYHDDKHNVYHLMGLIVALKGKKESNLPGIVSSYYKEYLKNTKEEFSSKLKADIREYLYEGKIDGSAIDNTIRWLKALDFDLNRDKIWDVLLCYNVAALINSNNSFERFPFGLFNNDDYDVEHINPKSKFSEEENEEIKRKNTKQIGNLVLLDANTNRSERYKVEGYCEKRRIIVQILRHGDDTENDQNHVKYIPIGTRWVFLEAFDTANIGPISEEWDKHEEYVVDIAKHLVKLLGKKMQDVKIEEGGDNE